MKLHRKIKHNEKVCHTQDLGSYAQGQGHSQVRGQIVPQKILSNNLQITEVNLLKLHKKINYNEKICHS